MKHIVFMSSLKNFNVIHKKFLLAGSVVLLMACGGPAGPTAKHETEDDPAATTDTIAVFTGSTDGMSAGMYIETENMVLEPGIKAIHILPYVTNDSTHIDEYMFSISGDNFGLYGDVFETYTGPVTVFYDAARQHKVAEFTLLSGKTNGTVKAWSVNGELVIERIYDNGQCVQSLVDRYATNWMFNPSTASLEIEALENYEYKDNQGNRLVEIGASYQPNTGDYKNQLYEIIEKPVFENVFMINAEPFTGKLTGYSEAATIEPFKYFELSFVDGKLHDTIRIYDEMFGLTLEERFENGALAETIYVLDESDMEGMAKPVIYLYPQQEMVVNVQLDLKGGLTHSYPKYPEGGWTVHARQNGTLYDVAGQEYYALFWEGVSKHDFTYSEGFVIAGNETEKFLETSLATLGLNRREANEFIMYWLPQLENNAYNLIHFSTHEYEEIAKLKITPAPESLLRVMMVWSPLDQPIEIPMQDLGNLAVKREGFSVVEWGGKKQPYIVPL